MTLCWQCLQTPFRTHQGRISVTLEKESATRELSDLSGDSLHTLMESWVPFPAHARHLWLSGESVSHRLGLCSLQAGAVHRIEARALRRGGPAVRRADPSSPHSKVDIAWGWARQGTGPPTKMAADGATAQQARFGKDSFPKSLTTGGRRSAHPCFGISPITRPAFLTQQFAPCTRELGSCSLRRSRRRHFSVPHLPSSCPAQPFPQSKLGHPNLRYSFSAGLPGQISTLDASVAGEHNL